MTTLEKLKFALTQKGIRFEEHQDGVTGKIGIRGRDVYHWFSHVEGCFFLFDHTYSQITGRTKRGTAHAIRIYKSIRRKTGIDLLSEK